MFLRVLLHPSHCLTLCFCSRVEFTVDDDDHLVEFIACRLPDVEMGGRTGNEPYKLLVDLGNNVSLLCGEAKFLSG